MSKSNKRRSILLCFGLFAFVTSFLAFSPQQAEARATLSKKVTESQKIHDQLKSILPLTAFILAFSFLERLKRISPIKCWLEHIQQRWLARVITPWEKISLTKRGLKYFVGLRKRLFS